jgi:hypothetical protein
MELHKIYNNDVFLQGEKVRRTNKPVVFFHSVIRETIDFMIVSMSNNIYYTAHTNDHKKMCCVTTCTISRQKCESESLFKKILLYIFFIITDIKK